MRFLFLLLLASSICLAGCETARQASYSGGTVVGEALSVPSAAVEGASAGYSGVGSEDNPYGR